MQPPNFPSEHLFPFLCTGRKALLKRIIFKILNVLFLPVSQWFFQSLPHNK